MKNIKPIVFPECKGKKVTFKRITMIKIFVKEVLIASGNIKERTVVFPKVTPQFPVGKLETDNFHFDNPIEISLWESKKVETNYKGYKRVILNSREYFN